MEVSSPMSSSSTDTNHTFPLSGTEFSSLPIMPLRSKIVEKVLENRVTLIVGATGCGKSSQVPQFLVDANVSPVICTQPRRFAVVAVSKTVAKARGCELGGEVGYHIGHSKHLSARSKIVFKTAGVLLDEMRDKGMNALGYKVVILDEIHERSVESDLVLVCLKQFLKKSNDLRVVLMSATADILRYRDYFRDLGRDERVEVLAIPDSSQQSLFQRRVVYLEQVTELLEINPERLEYRYCGGPNPSSAAAGMNLEVHTLIRDLVLHIHKNETDIQKGILVFLPTYQDLKQQWYCLKPLGSLFKVHILHSSIDTKQALTAMRIWISRRKVILATNIAESSVTIPKVAHVIDSCRSLQVFWDAARKRDSPELVWISKSQAKQRRGRTGRTCDGQIYRLVTETFFKDLKKYESPAILGLSLRQQVLQICCAESRAINDPKALLRKSLDPPDAEVVEDALRFLVQMGALEKFTTRGRHEPTFFGRLLASFSLSFEASVLVLKFGGIGFLREGILLGILMDTEPLPILHPFGEEIMLDEYAWTYFGGSRNNIVQMGRKEMALMGNLCAYQFWQRVFKDEQRLKRLEQLLGFEKMNGMTLKMTSLVPEDEEEWCSLHNLVLSSLHHVAERYDDILCSLHRFRPRCLGSSNGQPSYCKPCEFVHTCLRKSQIKNDTGDIAAEDEHSEVSLEEGKCFAVPFVEGSHFDSINIAKSFTSVLKEIRIQNSEDRSGNQHQLTNGDASHVNGQATQCVYFANGSCNRGTECSFSHSLEATRSECRYFFTLQGCRNGNSCQFSHDMSSSMPSTSTFCLPEDGVVNAASFHQLFPESSDGFLVILDDTTLRFTTKLAHHYDPTKIISTTSMSEASIFDQSLTGVKILWGLHHPYQTIIGGGEGQIPWKEVKCILWFPGLDNYSENLETQKVWVQNFFQYSALRILADGLSQVQVILTVNNIKFAQVQVEKWAGESFFFLKKSFPFDEETFVKLSDVVTMKNPTMESISKAVSYVFNLQPPSNIQFGDYAALLQKLLHGGDGSSSILRLANLRIS